MKFKIIVSSLFLTAVSGVVFLSSTSFTKPFEYKKDVEEKHVEEKKFTATHIETPNPVRGVYMTSWVAGTPSVRNNIVSLVEDTELNSIIIDIKDFSGKIAFHTDNEKIISIKSSENRIPDIVSFIEELHNKGIYVIGRITVFQDPHYAHLFLDQAVQKESDGSIWKDFKGLSFVDPGAILFWEYISELSKYSYSIGFDELNFDYIRYPSDGNMEDINFPLTMDELNADPDLGMTLVMERFFSYLKRELANTKAIMSADLFGMTTTNGDDLNIGQKLEYAEPYFDYLSPMVYPSHYPDNFIGIEKPAREPYRVVKYSMDKGIEKLINASSSPEKLRPWLQDFNLGATYTKDMVRAQMNAVYDSGLSSWMLWDAANTYTRDALLSAESDTVSGQGTNITP